MAFDPFEAAIQALPPRELSRLSEQIDRQIAQLRNQHEVVKRVLARKTPSTASGSGRADPRKRRRGPNAADRRRALIRRVIDTDKERQWLPVDLQARLEQEGEPVSRDYIRTLARRMVEDGELARHPSGNGFMALSGIASANGSGQEPLKEAET